MLYIAKAADVAARNWTARYLDKIAPKPSTKED